MTTEGAAARGPYDLAFFIAKSFGRSLPVVIVIGLVAAGSWYFIRELSSMQTRLIEAERKLATAQVSQAKAESAAQSSVDKARGDIMAEQAKRISELNDASVAVSRKIQELVNGQLENMTKLEARTTSQEKATAARQKDSEEVARKEIAALKQQVGDLEARRKSLMTDVAHAGYQELKARIVEELGNRYSMGIDPLIDLLRRRLTDQDIRPLAEADSKSTAVPWRYRMLLYVEFYRLTSDERLIEPLSVLLAENKSAWDSGTGRILQIRSKWTSAAEQSLTRLSMRMVLDETGNIEGRYSFIDGLAYGAIEQHIAGLSAESRNGAARSVGRLFLASTEQGMYCSQPLDLLRKLSGEASQAYASFALSSAAHTKATECIQIYIKGQGDLPPVSPDTIKKWVP